MNVFQFLCVGISFFYPISTHVFNKLILTEKILFKQPRKIYIYKLCVHLKYLFTI